MKKMIIYGFLIFIITLGTILFYVYDIIGTDYVNITSFAIATLILILSIGTTLRYIYQIKNEKAKGELFPYNWDGIREYDNEIPKGWAMAFIAAIGFVLYYILVGYPTWSFSQIGQYNEEVIVHNKQYEQKWKDIANDKEQFHKMGESIFLVQCTMCHGVLADGLNGKSRDLVKWSKEEHIVDTILNGASGSGYAITMPSGLANKKDAKAIASFVASEFFASKTTKYPELVSDGKKAYSTSCASCHGADGAGIATLAPSLKGLVSSVLASGRTGAIGIMPKFDNLNDIQKNALNAYIYSLE